MKPQLFSKAFFDKRKKSKRLQELKYFKNRTCSDYEKLQKIKRLNNLKTTIIKFNKNYEFNKLFPFELIPFSFNYNIIIKINPLFYINDFNNIKLLINKESLIIKIMSENKKRTLSDLIEFAADDYNFNSYLSFFAEPTKDLLYLLLNDFYTKKLSDSRISILDDDYAFNLKIDFLVTLLNYWEVYEILKVCTNLGIISSEKDEMKARKELNRIKNQKLK